MTIIGKDAVRASTQRVCAGPLASYVDRFAAFLAGAIYGWIPGSTFWDRDGKRNPWCMGIIFAMYSLCVGIPLGVFVAWKAYKRRLSKSEQSSS